MSQNCKVKRILFIVTVNKINGSILVNIKNRDPYRVSKKDLDYFFENFTYEGKIINHGEIYTFKTK